jgi:uncharacterized caspase-like protein
MKHQRFARLFFCLLISFVLAGPAAAGWYQNAKFGYRINFPDGWRIAEDAANDSVTATRPDNNVEIAVQAMDLQGQIGSADQLADLFTANVFGGFRFLSKQPDDINGIPGVVAAYLGQNNGKNVVIGAFYLVQPPTGFVMYAAMPAEQAEALSKRLDPVFDTFQRLGAAPQKQAAAPALAPAPAPAPQQTDEPPLDPIDAPYVSVGEARVRERPDVRGRTVMKLKPGEQIYALGRIQGTKWILVARNDEPIGYVLDRQIRDKALAARPAVASATPAAPAAVPAKNVPAGVDFGNYFALIIGNTGYKHFPELVTADEDAEAVAALLGESYGYQTQVLMDATRNQIIDAIEGYREKLGARDNLLIYYAGHGWLDKKAERGYWLPVDAKPDSKANWVSNTTITDSIKAMDARHVMIIADSCYSGTLTRGIKIKRRDANYFKRLAAKKARVAMTSGGLEPVSDTGGGGHSAFAKAFLDVLAQNDGMIDGAELFKRIERPVKLNADQTPAFSDIRKAGHEEGGDFIFVRR